MSRFPANRRLQRCAPAMMVPPILLCLAALTLYAIIANVWFSLNAMDLTQPWKTGFVGADNYVDAVTRHAFFKSSGIMLAFAGISPVIRLVLGTIVALALWQTIRGHHLFTTILVLPFGLTPVALALAWRLLLNPADGGLNQMLGLIALPKEPFEAAAMEGADCRQRIRYIALPMLKPLILVVILFRLIDLFRAFDTIWVITGGGSGNATETFNMLLYRIAFQNLNFGEASALAILMPVLIIFCTQPFLKRLILTMR